MRTQIVSKKSNSTESMTTDNPATISSQSVQQQAALTNQKMPFSSAQIMQMQKSIGNQAVIQLLNSLMQSPVQQAVVAKTEVLQDKPNKTGLPDALKNGVESLSGIDLSDVRVQNNSDKPKQLQALAYAQGNEIHIGPGQEQHLPHEAWHVVQQKQGRVPQTTQAMGHAVNTDDSLEQEADEMGQKAAKINDSNMAGTLSGKIGVTKDSHQAGCGCGKCSSGMSATLQLYKDGYAPRLADYARGPSDQAYSKATFQRPAKFDEETIDAVYQEATQQQVNNPVTGKPEIYYKCNSCDNYFPYEAMQIGHIENWADYVESTVPDDTSEARDAYNDLNNLYLQCSTCNQGHAFEEIMEMQNEDYDMNDPFIDDSQLDPDEDARAFNILRNEILNKQNRQGM